MSFGFYYIRMKPLNFQLAYAYVTLLLESCAIIVDTSAHHTVTMRTRVRHAFGSDFNFI